MRKRIVTPKKPSSDPAVAAFDVVAKLTGYTPKERTTQEKPHRPNRKAASK